MVEFQRRRNNLKCANTGNAIQTLPDKKYCSGRIGTLQMVSGRRERNKKVMALAMTLNMIIVSIIYVKSLSHRSCELRQGVQHP